MVLAFLASLPAGLAGANGKRYRNRSQVNGQGRNGGWVAPVSNQAYRAQCGACHFVYQPGLLPARSWDRIIAGRKDHFGQEISLEPGQAESVRTYLRANAADTAGSRVSRRVMNSLAGQTPLRVTQVPFILHQHMGRKLPPGVFKRKSVGSLANCAACHPTADRGIYDAAYVRIPE
ncbi:hypothetical protein AAU61_19130 [Desulfocarbo indianensis]|nr:hypothetical protein AAU61_19130 [Desulfocarbo indianensis]